MELINKLEQDIPISIFLAELKVDISNTKNYLINKIEENINNNSNLSFKTNILGYMTDWKCFMKDKVFIEILDKGLKELTKHIQIKNCFLAEAWGIKITKGNSTTMHNHAGASISGVFYLNDADVDLIFPQINKQIKPKEGSIIFFSSMLNHGTQENQSNIDKYAIPFNLKNYQ